MNEVYVRKLGNCCTLYTNESGQSIPFEDVDNPPEFYNLIQTMSYDQLLASFPKGTRFRFIEPPKRDESSAKRLDASQLRQHMQGLDIPQEEIDKMLAAPIGTSKAVLEEPPRLMVEFKQEGEDMTKVLTEFRILMAKHVANPANPDIKKEVTAVANFLLGCWPELEPKLVEAKEAAFKPKFSL